MQRAILATVVIILVVIVLALQNAAATSIQIIAWQFHVSLALLISFAFLVGVATAIAFYGASFRQLRHLIKEKEQTIKELQDNLLEYKNILNPSEQIN
jgi:uncharacterized integral membrane protein